MPKYQLSLWAASLLAAHAATSAIPLHNLFTRQSTCAATFNRCQNDGFPDYFCCPAGQTCISLAGNTTLLCCPKGTCEIIQPVPCDISLQDGERNPEAVIKTTALGGTMKRCAGQCCPFGYSCLDDECVKDKDQNAVPIQTAKPTSTSTNRVEQPTATSSSSSSPVPTNAPGLSDGSEENEDGEDDNSSNNNNEPANSNDGNDAASEEASNNPSPAGVIAGGVIAGLAILLATIAGIYFILKKKSKLPAFLGGKKHDGSPKGPKFSRSTSSFGNLISNPIVAENSTFRSDFARGSPAQKQDRDSVSDISTEKNGLGVGGAVSLPIAAQMMSTTNRQQQQQGQQYRPYTPSPDSRTRTGTRPGADSPSPQTPFPSGTTTSSSANNDYYREPSSVSINVFADPSNLTPDPGHHNHQRRGRPNTPPSPVSTTSSSPGSGRGGGKYTSRYSTTTTFTQMLDRADLGGLARGESYLDGYGNNGNSPGRMNNVPPQPPMPRRLV
ncbi:hypothetical protein VTJ04DRAFT_3685 [Mycothermus thermophilus]|uniref:uncharacterized protein n=1 Tax=Humicola insolens TaxID=85995 RepID=UPI003743204A